MKVIGLTGGIAAGKSTVASYLRQQGLPVFDADAVVRQATEQGSPCLPALKAAFGAKAFTQHGVLDRRAVAALVFADPAARQKLEKIIHAYVTQQKELFLSQKKHEKAVVLDVPLLIECGWYKHVDQVWLVAISEQQQVARAMARSGLSAAEVGARIAAQMPLAVKKQYADVILDNSGSVADLEKQVAAALTRI